MQQAPAYMMQQEGQGKLIARRRSVNLILPIKQKRT
jgi:hypothetical protein